jgi:aldose 1-epimerase
MRSPPTVAAPVNLERPHWRVALLPALGGRIGSCCWRHPDGRWIDILAPMGRLDDYTEDAGCFPLTPFSNRVRQGRFAFRGRTIHLPRNTSGPHPEHGHGWQRRWAIVAAEERSALLRYTHDADAWPFRYEIDERIELTSESLRIVIAARNTGDQPMPYGFGLHPYFPSTPATTLAASVRTVWQTDAEVMPTRRVAAAELWGRSPVLSVQSANLDNGFGGWDGIAEIRWPERNTALTMAAAAPLRQFVVYAPRGAGFFCAEPVSNCTDAFNLAGEVDNTGLIVLEPGGSVAADISLSPFAID